jgi:serine/threonine protein kinase
MAVRPRTRFGPQEILSAVGVGGMGEVYRAKDTRLDRIVAIKIVSATPGVVDILRALHYNALQA